MTGCPPLLAGGVKLTETLAFPAITAPIVGALGTVAGVIVLDARDGKPEPTELVATTLKVYAVPFIRPATVNGLALPVAVSPPGLEVTV